MTEANVVTPKGAFSYAWETIKKRLFFFALITFVSFSCQIIPGLYLALIEGKKDALLFFIAIYMVAIVVQLGFTLGATHIFLATVDGKQTTLKDLFSKFKLGIMFRYSLSQLLILLLMIAVGAVVVLLVFLLKSIPFPDIIFINSIASLFQIVGIYTLVIIITLKTYFTTYFIVDKNAGPVEAIKKSFALTDGRITFLIIFIVISYFVNFLGVLAFIMGLLVAAPVTNLAIAYLYRRFSSEPPQAEADSGDVSSNPESENVQNNRDDNPTEGETTNPQTTEN